MSNLTKRGRIALQSSLTFAAATAVTAGLIAGGSSASAATADSASRVTVDNASVNVLCTGSTSTKPPIVLVAGEGDPLTKFTSLQATLSKSTRVCSYDRPGEGASSHFTSSQTLSSSATLLDDVLKVEKVNGKVVVVGHSLGGLIAAQFAHQYPAQVAGVVLFDATPPSFGPALLSLIPKSSTGILAGAREEVGSYSSATKNPEGLVYGGQPIGSLGAIPLTVVEHGEQVYRDVPQYGNEMQVLWAKGQQQWTGLSTHSKLVTASHSGHYIYLDQPALAVRLIEQATAA